MSKKPEKVAVIGAGILGAQIAMMAAHGGYSVKIFDPLKDAFFINYNKIKDDLKSKNVTPFIPWDQWERCKSSVQRLRAWMKP